MNALLGNRNCIVDRLIVEKTKLFPGNVNRESPLDPLQMTFEMSLYIILHREIVLKSEKEEGAMTFGIKAMKVDFIDLEMNLIF